MRPLTSLTEHRLLVFLGKGGVGESTLAAAVARLLAARGKRVLLCETSPDGAGRRLPGLLRVAPETSALTAIGDNLWLVNVQPEAALHEYAVMKLRLERVVNRLLDNKLVHYFLRLLPALAETVTLGKILYHVKEEGDGRRGGPRFDTVVVDAPATGHGISLLQLPQVLLKAAPPGPLRDDMLWMNDLLIDPQITAVQLVTLPEELPVNETLELSATLRDTLHIPRGLCFVNGLWPQRFAPGELAALAGRAPAALLDVAERLQTQADIGAGQLARLSAEIDLPVVSLPQLFRAEDGAAVVDEVERLLALALAPATSVGKGAGKAAGKAEK